MILSLFYLLSFALAINCRPSLGPVSNVTDHPLFCYGKEITQLEPTNMEDCRELATIIMSLPPWGRPWVFSSIPNTKADKKLPMGLKAGSCHLRIIPVDLGAQVTDAFTARHLAHQMHRTINQCVAPSPHLGGEGEIGPKKILAITLSGPFAYANVDWGDELTNNQGGQRSELEDYGIFSTYPPQNSSSQS